MWYNTTNLLAQEIGDVGMENKICCFAGHRDFSYGEDFGEKLKEVLRELVTKEEVTEFFVGNYGNFDRFCARTVRKIKEEFPFIKLTLVIPYITEEIEKNKEYFYSDYDSILIAEMHESTPRALKIIKCNEYMVTKSKFLVAYVKYDFGGAYKTLSFALRKGKNCINLGK